MFDDSVVDSGGGTTFGRREVTRERIVRRAMQAARNDSMDLDWGKLDSGMGAFTQRWKLVSHYRQDLVTYALYSPRWQQAFELTRRDLLDGLDEVVRNERKFSELIISVATKDMRLRLRFARYLIFQFSLTIDPAYAELAYRAHELFYRRSLESWTATYHEALGKIALKLRGNVTAEKLRRLFSALAQGLAMMAAYTGRDAITRTEDDIPFLAEGIMLMLVGALNTGDGRPAHEVVDQLFA
jgi:hypothetical protein